MHEPQIISVNDPVWDALLTRCRDYDFYHTRSYHLLETRNNGYEAVLFVSHLDDSYMALPLVIRSIPQTPYFDCTSVYGYCGPVSTIATDAGAGPLIRQFQKDLRGFFREKNIIAAFSRLHPLINTKAVFNDFGIIRDVNKTVAIDLGIAPDAQRQQYRKSNKSELNQLRKRKGYSVKKAETEAEITTFVSIYTDTMQRVDAAPYYFFEKDYFRLMLNNFSYQTELLLAIKDGQIAAGAIFTITNNIMQYHLAGTAAPYIYDTPMKLILDEARLRANELALDFLHLGGGVGGSDEDSLFRFKSGFSKQFFQFSTWQHIINESVYRELAEINGVKDHDYFPLYRAPKP